MRSNEVILIFVLVLGGFGLFSCLIWAYELAKESDIWGILFLVGVICFCTWAIYKGVYEPLRKKKD